MLYESESSHNCRKELYRADCEERKEKYLKEVQGEWISAGIIGVPNSLIDFIQKLESKVAPNPFVNL